MYEPKADNRQQATEDFDQYQAYLQAGFSEEQAMSLILVIKSAAVQEVVRQYLKGND